MNLEDRALNIEVYGRGGGEILQVTKIEGHVTSVRGMLDPSNNKKYLRIHLDSDTQKDDVIELNFCGESPVKGGDKIRAGLILGESSIDALYLELLDERGHYLRRDFSDEYTTHISPRDLGLED